MAGYGFVKLGKCAMIDLGYGHLLKEVDDLVLNTSHINRITPLKNENGQKLGARITTIFHEAFDVPAPSVKLDNDYDFNNIVKVIVNAGKEGFSSII